MPEKRPLPSEGSTALVEATKRQKLNEMVLATQKGNQVVQAVRYILSTSWQLALGKEKKSLGHWHNTDLTLTLTYIPICKINLDMNCFIVMYRPAPPLPAPPTWRPPSCSCPATRERSTPPSSIPRETSLPRPASTDKYVSGN